MPPCTRPKVRHPVQHTQYLGPDGRGHIFKACGAGKGQGEKKGLQQKTEKLLRRALLIRALLERAGERPTCSKLARRKRLAEIGTKRENRSRARARQKHGVEQSTAPSRAAAARDDGSSGVRAVELQIVSSARDHKIFGLRRCGLAPGAYFPAPRGAQGAPKKWSYRWPLQATSSTLLLVRCKGVDMDVRYANMGNSYSIMRRFTRH